MKTIAAIFAGAALVGAALLGVSLFARTSAPLRQTKDEDGHVLSALWKEYKTAKAKDLPQDQLKILEKIKEQAQARVLAYDFWDASRKFTEVSESRNWKHPIWAVAELCGRDDKVFLSKTVFVAKGRLEKIEFPYLPEYGDNVYLTLLFFNDYSYQKFDANYYHEKILRALPLAVTRFTDSAAPSSEVTVELESVPGAEAVASVWDKAADVIRMNRWGSVYVPFKEALPIFPDIAVFKPYYGSIRAYGLAVQSYAEDIVNAKGVVIDDDEVEKAAPSAVRSVFSEALYFDPYLKADAEGRVRLSFKTSDKLSTYRLAVFAHDSQLRSSVIEKEFKVTIPVKVDVLKPEYLYDGDEFSLTATVSSGVASDLSGNLAVYQYDGADYRNLQPLAVTSETVTIPAGGVVKHQFGIRTEAEGASSPTLGLLVSFKGDDGTTDAMFFTVPVLERAQTLTESHSAVLYGGADREALMKDLQGRFTGTTAYGAVAGEISVLDMVKEVLDGKLGEPREDIVSLTEALYVRVALSQLKEISPNDNMGSLLEKIFALQNEDGGFAWFKGFKSSPILTALVLERFHKMRFLNLSEAEGPLAKAVKYLDANQFSKEPIHCWRGGLSQEQYLYVRAAYASVPFEVPYKSSKDLYKNFERDIDGCIMAKARRLATLKLLAASAEGEALAKAWGIKSPKKLKASADADAASLVQYAVRHRDGGWYYPNAVMPWRGLLETEAYAHTILASLLPSADLANGIRLWLMLQKETQHWDTTPHFVDAVACILEGSKEVLDTKVLTLTKTYRGPFGETVSAGNGFTISREFFREVAAEDGKIIRQTLSQGDTVRKGEKITAVFHVYNEENRSFVRLHAPREATLSPVNQISGHTWRGYREVRTTYTDWFFDSFPEEKVDVTEEYFVTQTGTFSCGVPEIESLYAPHYRANGPFPGPLTAQ